MNSNASIGRILLACVFAVTGAAAAAPAPSLPGLWHATLQTAAGSYTLELSVKQDPQGAFSASLESIDQAPGEAIAVGGVELHEDQLTLKIDALGAAYEGRFDAGQDAWLGNWRQGRALPLAWLRGPVPTAPNIAGIDGDWRATLNRNGTDLHLILHVRSSARGTRAKLDSPDMGIAGLDVTGLRREGNRIYLRVPEASVVFEGELGDGATSLSGRWQRQGMPGATLRFTRPAQPVAAALAAPRPQTPRAPFAYRVQEVRFANPQANITLAGTLTLPPGRGPFAAAVLISGSGPADRDQAMFGHRPFAVLADHLTRQGIAVLRCDVRGVGDSGGRFDGAVNADLAGDVRAAVQFLRGQPGIDPKAVGLIGHSQGGIVGPLAALHNPAVAYVVLLAAPATSMAELLLAQRRMTVAMMGQGGTASADHEAALATLFAASALAQDRAAAQALIGAMLTPELLRRLDASEAQKPGLVGELSSDWLRDVLRYDAPATLGALTVPLLALNGSLDRQVPAAANLAAIRLASAGNRDATTLQLA
ncbi:MAG: alpha/beta fold hydrolase, partial [Pseudomonadota bacterium]|nr:alpha/beta fold hydrolase [Pseudomonadota bacterium]